MTYLKSKKLKNSFLAKKTVLYYWLLNFDAPNTKSHNIQRIKRTLNSFFNLYIIYRENNHPSHPNQMFKENQKAP